MKKVLLPALCVVVGVARAATVLTGSSAIDKIKAAIPGADVSAWNITSSTVKWSTIMTGVDMAFFHAGNFYGVPDDVTMLRIAYRKAPLRMKLVYNKSANKRTSEVTKSNGALFGVSGTFYNASTRALSYRVKTSGTIATPDAGGGTGLLFNDKDPYKLMRFTSGFKDENLMNQWDNALPSDCVLLNGKCALEGSHWTSGNPSAGFPVLGISERMGLIYLFVIDGRRSGKSQGITYLDSYTLLDACGCDGGYVLDGGGSTTLAMKSDLVPSGFSQVQWNPSYASGYTVMNYTNTSNEEKPLERYVLTQLLFMPGEAAQPFPDGTFFEAMCTNGKTTDGQCAYLDYTPYGDSSVEASYLFPKTPVSGVNQCFWCSRRTLEIGDLANQFTLFAAVSGNMRYDYGTGTSADTRQQTGWTPTGGKAYDVKATGNKVVQYNAGSTSPVHTFTAKSAVFTDQSDGRMSVFMSYKRPERPWSDSGAGWDCAATMDLKYMRCLDKIDGVDYLKVALEPSFYNGRFCLYDAVADKYYPSIGPREFSAVTTKRLAAGTTLCVAGSPLCVPCSTLGVSYGVKHTYKTGDAVNVKVPSGEQTVSAGVRATLTGWKVRQNGTTTTKTSDFTVTFGSTDVRLEAQWNVKCRLTATVAGGRGTVSGDGWKTYGLSATLTATPARGGRFLGWEGDVGAADPQSATITVSMDRPRALTAKFDDPTPDWSDPSEMAGGTVAEKTAAAMKAQGFDEAAAATVAAAGMDSYWTVAYWSQAWANGWQARGESQKPSPADLARVPGLLTSAAIGASRPLAEGDVKIKAIEPSADGGVTVRVSLGEYKNLLAGDQALLRAALGVAGAYGLGGANAFSAENVTVSAKTVEAEAVELQAKPKSVQGGTPSQFFYRATAR